MGRKEGKRLTNRADGHKEKTEVDVGRLRDERFGESAR